jgi:hypothetical protein
MGDTVGEFVRGTGSCEDGEKIITDLTGWGSGSILVGTIDVDLHSCNLINSIRKSVGFVLPSSMGVSLTQPSSDISSLLVYSC